MVSPTKLTCHRRTDQALQLLKAISKYRSSDFSGVGVVFYDDLTELPHLQLTNDREKPDASQFSNQDKALTLAAISTMACPLHDGFHFVEARRWDLTHLSQFISPPIPHDAAQRFNGTGARLMAAVLASLLPGIVCVGLVSHGGEIHLFSGGVDIAKES